MNDLSNKQKIISYVLKGIVFLSALVGTILSAIASSNAFMGGETVFMYFTIQSNIAIAIICLIGAILIIRNKNINYIWLVIKLVGTVAITLTGVVFCFVLAPTMGGNAFGLSNVLTHVIVPVESIIDFFIVANIIKYRKIDILFVIIPPLLYAIYADIGFVANWNFGAGNNYPYFFLNWGSEAGAFGFSSELPFIGTMWWILLLLMFLIGVGLLYTSLNNIIRNKLNKTIDAE